MTRRLVVTRRAKRAVDRLRIWWEDNRPDAPNAVSDDLEAALALLVEQPGIGQMVTQASVASTRRLHLERIRHWLYYRTTDEELRFLTVWSTSRGRSPTV